MNRAAVRFRSLHVPLVIVALALPACSKVRELLGRGDGEGDDAGVALVDADVPSTEEDAAAAAEGEDAAPSLPVEPVDPGDPGAPVTPVAPGTAAPAKPKDGGAADAAPAPNPAVPADAGFALPKLDAAVPALPALPFDAGALRDRMKDSGLPQLFPR